jgi:hypothetical protein
MFKLVEMALTIGGERYYLVFSPWYKTWVRFGKLKDVCSSNLYPWVSWATHEDNKNFLSKSFADDLYGVADATHTFFNQELTNREKRNFNARGYDIEMFPDVAKLDQAQTRPDALVPVKVPAGKRIEDGIFTFETAELRGTIDLLDWMQGEAGRDVGVTDLSMGGVQQASKKATVVFAEQQSISKRLLLRSSSYTEAMGEVAKLFIQGCKDHLPAKKALKSLGIEGEGWEPVIRRADLDLYSDPDVRVVSSTVEMQQSQLKKEARLATIDKIITNPRAPAARQRAGHHGRAPEIGRGVRRRRGEAPHGHQELRQQGGRSAGAPGHPGGAEQGEAGVLLRRDDALYANHPRLRRQQPQHPRQRAPPEAHRVLHGACPDRAGEHAAQGGTAGRGERDRPAWRSALA